MTLDNFIPALRECVDDFERHWREKNAEDPANYPSSFSDEDGGEEAWFEQFSAFLEVRALDGDD